MRFPWQKSDEEKLKEAKERLAVCEKVFEQDSNCRNLRNYTHALMEVKSIEKKIKEKEQA
ncbi:MAG: hypothetical protein IKM15_05090 [Peptococcaceae bacterium]|nr:hypothetical protein [Peptococcaceae bacterium]